ncbi:hypothetical protein ANCCAN_14365 [Ancylostoma caninum]|uniref:Uncharacterized protein n=1 Tax=Ancylostoma caninum TaxID=29170 RepID=A0A368G9L8_ANCCA|nr:hypothetical protein ANCCAN_14365 [Ancylostoma caninum]
MALVKETSKRAMFFTAHLNSGKPGCVQLELCLSTTLPLIPHRKYTLPWSSLDAFLPRTMFGTYLMGLQPSPV